jgi:hypothetical protein
MFAVCNGVSVALSCDTTEITKVLPVRKALDSVPSWEGVPKPNGTIS